MEKSRRVPLRRLQAVVDALAANQRRVYGIGLVMHRRSRAGQIVDVVETGQLVFERPDDVAGRPV